MAMPLQQMISSKYTDADAAFDKIPHLPLTAPPLTWGGHPTELRCIGDDVIIRCKDTLGLYSQVRAFVYKEFSIDGIYHYGVGHTPSAVIQWDPTNRDSITIACLTATKQEWKALEIACEQLIQTTKTNKHYDKK